MRPELWDETDPLVVAKMTGFGNDLSIDREIFATIAKRLHAAAFDSIELIRPMRERFTVPPEGLPMGKGAWGGACEALNGTASCTEKPEFSSEHASMSGLPRRRVLGSNNWAIDGRFTDTGRPLIAGDPHQGFDVPGMFYALHMNSADQGGTLDVAGFSFSAVPGISLGQTQRVMWTATTSFADVMDVWEVVRENGAIRYGGMMVPIVERDEVIAIRKPGMPLGQGDSNTETFEDLGQVGVILPSFVTPVPVASPGRSLLLGWTGYRPRGVRGLLGINRVDSIAEFEAEVDKAESLISIWWPPMPRELRTAWGSTCPCEAFRAIDNRGSCSMAKTRKRRGPAHFCHVKNFLEAAPPSEAGSSRPTTIHSVSRRMVASMTILGITVRFSMLAGERIARRPKSKSSWARAMQP
ncbi:MAG: penicillin acylase family protein [Polyangiaceae bacterium]|nr:penicillin acylase family protein [Polyangiaceae bacterium]